MRPPLEQDAPVLRRLGIETQEDSRSGQVLLSLKVAQDSVNASGRCHGGLLFALADTAAAYACFIDCGRKPATVEARIQYLKPAREGDLVTASARVVETSEKVAKIAVDLRLANGVQGESIASAEATCVLLP